VYKMFPMGSRLGECTSLGDMETGELRHGFVRSARYVDKFKFEIHLMVLEKCPNRTPRSFDQGWKSI
jgi:hypothetical protein